MSSTSKRGPLTKWSLAQWYGVAGSVPVLGGPEKVNC